MDPWVTSRQVTQQDVFVFESGNVKKLFLSGEFPSNTFIYGYGCLKEPIAVSFLKPDFENNSM